MELNLCPSCRSFVNSEWESCKSCGEALVTSSALAAPVAGTPEKPETLVAGTPFPTGVSFAPEASFAKPSYVRSRTGSGFTRKSSAIVGAAAALLVGAYAVGIATAGNDDEAEPVADVGAVDTTPNDASAWIDYRSPEYGFLVEMPSVPKVTNDNVGGSPTVLLESKVASNTEVLVRATDFDELTSSDQLLTMSLDEIAVGTGSETKSSIIAENDGRRHLDAVLQNDRQRMNVSMFIIDGKLYQLAVLSPAGSSDPETFGRLVRSFSTLSTSG